jgi:hypothetical protein
MDQQDLQIIIRQKLQTGALPRNSIPRIWGGPGSGEICDACDSVIPPHDEWVMEGIGLPPDRTPLQLHVECFHLGERERRALSGQPEPPLRPTGDGPTVG